MELAGVFVRYPISAHCCKNSVVAERYTELKGFGVPCDVPRGGRRRGADLARTRCAVIT